MTNNPAITFLAGLAILMPSCGGVGRATQESKRAVHAQTEVVGLSPVTDYVEAPGTIRAKTSTVLSSNIAGQILTLSVREGDRVRQGQTVAEIDDRESSARLRQAQAGVAEAHLGLEESNRSVQAAETAVRVAETNRNLAVETLKRYDLLRERRSVSLQEYDEVETKSKAATLEVEHAKNTLEAAKARWAQIFPRIDQAEAGVDAAQVARGYSRIASPIDGIVVARHAEPGMLAAPGLRLLTIEDSRTYELEVSVGESGVGAIAVGLNTRIEIDALRGRALGGRVREIAPASDPASRTYAVRLQIAGIPQNGQDLRSGFFGRTFFPTEERQALLVPESALRRRGQLEGVYIVKNNAVLLRLVKTGQRYGPNIEILSGLTPGTRILTAPTADISDGVTIVYEDFSGRTP